MIHVIDTPLVFCDVETTGGNAMRNRITEIACIRYEHGVEVARINTLVNPHQPIPFKIQVITHITNTMTDSARDFADIASEVDDIFNDATLVAHHARFDYSFIKVEMERSGYKFNVPQICTAKLSRRLYSQYQGHGLSKIIDRFSFDCNARHRALGDAEVLVQFAAQIEADHSPEKIYEAIENTRGKTVLPPNLAKKIIDNLPKSPGVYSFLGANSELLYVGKSIDIRSRVLSHFSNANRDSKARRLWSEVHNIEIQETTCDFSAQLLEIHKIKNEMPIYNRQLRKNERLWGLVRVDTKSDYLNFALKPLNNDFQNDIDRVFSIYRTKKQALASLETIVRDNKLCPRLMGIESGSGECFSSQLDRCSGACANKISPAMYNAQVELLLKKQKVKHWPFNGPKELIFHRNDRSEKFIIDNWILKEAKVIEDQAEYEFFNHGGHFDYDIYRVISKELLQIK